MEPVKKPGKRSKFDPLQVMLPDWLPAETWAMWVKDRADRGMPITDAGAKLQLRSLAKLRDEGESPVLVIETAIERGWRGLFAGPNGRTKAGVNDGKSQAHTTAEGAAIKAQIAALPANWYELAGFETKHDANGSGCHWMNYTEFRNRERIVPKKGVPA